MNRFNCYKNNSWVKCWNMETIYSNHWGWMVGGAGHFGSKPCWCFCLYRNRSVHWDTEI